jgi:hypothetical protein
MKLSAVSSAMLMNAEGALAEVTIGDVEEGFDDDVVAGVVGGDDGSMPVSSAVV